MTIDIGTIRTNIVDCNYDKPLDSTKFKENLVRLTREEIDDILKNSPDKKITLESGVLDIDHAFKTNKSLGSIIRDVNESKPTYIMDVRHGVIQKKNVNKITNHSSEKPDKSTQTDLQPHKNINEKSEIDKNKKFLGIPKINAGVAAGIGVITAGIVRLIKDIVDLCTKVNNDEQYDSIGEDSANRAVNDKIESDFQSYLEAVNSGDAEKLAEVNQEMSDKYYKTAVGDFVFSPSYVKPEYLEGELSDISNTAREQGISTAKQTAKNINKTDFATDSVITGLGFLTIGASLSSYRSSKKNIGHKPVDHQNNPIEHKNDFPGAVSKNKNASEEVKNISPEREQIASMLTTGWR
ncbi:hypothetical protein CF635_003504 [Enterobacter hormaechei]|nr:hypothetical protein [Enterobacter hormaechei]